MTLKELYDLGASAIEKQIPKKVVEFLEDRYCCPVCKAIRYPKAPYCEHCGQALDWGEEE